MPDWGAAGWAGIIAGTVAMLTATGLLPWAYGGNVWVPVRFVAAIVLGRQVLPPPPYFIEAQPSSALFLLALALHYSLALIYLRVLSAMIYRLDLRTSIAAGAALGLALYVLNFYVFTGAFPWFREIRGPVALLYNLLFGVTAAAAYKALERREPLDGDPPAATPS